jgi:hypothetical protein
MQKILYKNLNKSNFKNLNALSSFIHYYYEKLDKFHLYPFTENVFSERILLHNFI